MPTHEYDVGDRVRVLLPRAARGRTGTVEAVESVSRTPIVVRMDGAEGHDDFRFNFRPEELEHAHA